MVFEIATIEVKPGFAEDFESGVTAALPLFTSAAGYKSLRLERSIENAFKYRLVVGWRSVEDHTISFRNSDSFQVWRSLVAHTFAAPPSVEHTTVILTGSEKVGDD